jgi:hypothetical protein
MKGAAVSRKGCKAVKIYTPEQDSLAARCCWKSQRGDFARGLPAATLDDFVLQ